MKIQYIFIKKQNSTVDIQNSNKLFQNMFKKIFDNVTFDTFQTIIDDQTETISFKSSTSPNKEEVYLTLSVEGKPSVCAHTLSLASERLICGKHRKDFYIITAYDQSSEYYCEKLAPRFGKFERLMRSFIYTTLIKILGVKWFEESFTEEMKNAIKEKGNISDTNLIEHGLYEMTFSQLYDYLFKEFSYCSPESAVYEQLLNNDLENMNKDKIVAILNCCKKESLWNRFFGTASFDLQEPLATMREYRNKVYHNKFINHSEYIKCKKDLSKINSTLDNAIEQLNSSIYTEKHLFDSVMSFAALFAGLLRSKYDFSALQESFNVLGKTLIKAFEPHASTTKMKAMYNLGSFVSEFKKISDALNVRVKSEFNKQSISDISMADEFSELEKKDNSDNNSTLKI